MPKEHVMLSRKNIIYENWKVYSKQNKLMFRCNEKKVKWYLKRNLAVETAPNTIQLTFEAKGQGHDLNDYMVEDRTNICVACGSNQNLTLHHVVPEMYRHWMPLSIKSKSSRDLLLLCKDCHGRYEDKALQLKKQCVKRFDIPMEGKGWIHLPLHRTVKKAASALLRSSDKIPEERQKVLRMTIEDFCNQDDTERNEDWQTTLLRCSELEDHYKGEHFIEHGDSVIQQLTENEVISSDRTRWPDLEKFIKEWRQHFLDHLEPKFLSEKWTVDGPIYASPSIE
ncbi:hypothetical protein K501DRAFT_222197 [Backusella circina FSU 941]|nr:hypothetical protein K501DRAFT_222197 [Backusella circina FSU 941]